MTKVSHFYAVLDKFNNYMSKHYSLSRAVASATKNPYAVKVKEVTHTIEEEIVWERGK